MAKNETKDTCRLNRVGGQAVLEGVMMKAGEKTVTTCRKPDGTLVVNDDKFVSVRKKHKLLNIPILRGVVNFVEMMMLSVKTLNASADALGIEEEEGKFEKWLKKHIGIGLTDVIMFIGVILGLALSLFLFMYLPVIAAQGIDALYMLISGSEVGMHESIIALLEGVMKVAIFLSYLALVSLIPDIKRTFMYHGAEHKSIACFEAGEELTPENAKRHTRFHPRCGTSFMFLMIALGIFVGMFVRNMLPNLPDVAYVGIRLAILPLVMGIGYELLMIMGKHDNIVTRIISAPGMWVQRLTTKEPTDDMLEVAIISIKCALRDDFPEFGEFFESRPWEADGGETIIGGKKPETKDETAEASADSETRAESDAALAESEAAISESSTESTIGESTDNTRESDPAEADSAEVSSESATDGETPASDDTESLQ